MSSKTSTFRPLFERMAKDLQNERQAGDLFADARANAARQQAISETAKKMGELRAALASLLDCVDYTTTPPSCRQNEMIGAVLPRAVIDLARRALK